MATSSIIANAGDSSNRLELLLFGLGGRRRYGINVLKVKEVIPCPPLNQLPDASPNIVGVANLRGSTTPIIDLAGAIGMRFKPLTPDVVKEGSVIVSELNRSRQGFWVSSIDKIVILDWQDIAPPSAGTGPRDNYITGITLIEDEMIQILDVEKVIAEVLGVDSLTEQFAKDGLDVDALQGKHILVVDDSSMAIKMTLNVLNELGLKTTTAHDGKVALDILNQHNELGQQDADPIDMIISDIEMPEMDGYTFVEELRKLPRYKQTQVLLHTSLNGTINKDKAASCGANGILTKFVPEELARAVSEQLVG